MSAQCVMICSGKGGTGKSTVSVLLGAGLARLGRKVLLVELDSGLRSVDIIAGVYGRTVYDIEDVLCGRCVPSPLYAGLSVISAPYEGGEVAAVPLGRLLQAVRPYFDLILLDTAAGMGAPFSAAATVADRALLVLTPDPVALRDGKIVADRLLAGHGPRGVYLAFGGLFGLGVAALSFAATPLAFGLLYLALYLAFGIATTAQSVAINADSPPEVRATLLSGQGFALQIGGFAASLGASLFADRLGVPALWQWGAGLFLAGMLVTGMLLRGGRKTK